MAHVTFDRIAINKAYSRQELADLWGYRGWQAFSRGVFTPRNQSYILLFVTREKQSSAHPYVDRLEGDRLYWEGPTDHVAEKRMTAAPNTRDEIHLFCRDRHHSDFTYLGELSLESVTPLTVKSSEFVFRRVQR